jgi:serine/threonine protein kinase
MANLSKPIVFETATGTFKAYEIIGEGAAGRVYGAKDSGGAEVAIKVLAADKASEDRRRRFKNELIFLAQNKHLNIVSVTDHGLAAGFGPFYVMKRYDCSLRKLMEQSIGADTVLPLFSQILNGAEAAHLQQVVHRDLKPENILYDKAANALAIADFGTARFTEELIATSVETDPGQRLANFQYAAPEQRKPGKPVGQSADIHALGLILNEMVTGAVPLGTAYKQIGQVVRDLAFLDPIVELMLRQEPNERPGSIADVKILIQKHQSEAVTLQRLSRINGTVINATEIDEPLADSPPKLVGFDWDRGTLILKLDRPVTTDWIQALYRMGSFTNVLGKPPQVFNFEKNRAIVDAREHEVQLVIDNFKLWLPQASRTLKQLLEDQAKRDEAARRENLRREREEEERRLRLLRTTRI